jgi:dimethylhistidine N-methyltransferase
MRLADKRLPCKYFYDEQGCRLFDEICLLDEYYPTRTELSIMNESADDMAAHLGSEAMLIELGSGSGIKTRILLDHLGDPVAYVPVDIARDHLELTATELAGDYPEIEILPVCADFTQSFALPAPTRRVSHRTVYFPGSTIGNFQRHEVTRLLRSLARLCSPDGGLLIGIDLKKDPKMLEAAYNDCDGITAEFNLNLLHRINRELDADFDIRCFRHQAYYLPEPGRIEMHLVSTTDQLVTIAGHQFEIAEGESICTEHSHKYTVSDFEQRAAQCGWTLRKSWTDPDQLFAVLYLEI